MDLTKIATGVGIIGLGFATPIPVIDDAIGVLIGVPMILTGLGQEEEAEKLEGTV